MNATFRCLNYQKTAEEFSEKLCSIKVGGIWAMNAQISLPKFHPLLVILIQFLITENTFGNELCQ